MNDITYAVSVDVNNPIIPYNVYVASVLDSNVRYLEITLYQNGNVIALSNEATATASLVTDDVLIDDSVECTISNNIITVPLEDLQRHGNLDVQVTVTEGTKALAIPFPIQVRVTPNIAEEAQIDENSLGSYAEVVHEIAEARGTYTTLHDAITAKLDGKLTVKPIPEGGYDDCTESNTLYYGYAGGYYVYVLPVVVTGSSNQSQYKLRADNGLIECRTRHYSNGAWGSWDNWTPVGREGNIADGAVTWAKLAAALQTAINAKAPASTAYTFDSTTTTVVYSADNPKTIYTNAYVNGKSAFVLTTANNHYQIALCYDGTEYTRQLTGSGSTTYNPWLEVQNNVIAEEVGDLKSAIDDINDDFYDYVPASLANPTQSGLATANTMWAVRFPSDFVSSPLVTICPKFNANSGTYTATRWYCADDTFPNLSVVTEVESITANINEAVSFENVTKNEFFTFLSSNTADRAYYCNSASKIHNCPSGRVVQSGSSYVYYTGDANTMTTSQFDIQVKQSVTVQEQQQIDDLKIALTPQLIEYERARGSLLVNGTLNRTLNIYYKKYTIPSGETKIFLDGTTAHAGDVTGFTPCVLWFVSNGTMMSNQYVSVSRPFQTWDMHEVSIPSGAEEIWAEEAMTIYSGSGYEKDIPRRVALLENSEQTNFTFSGSFTWSKRIFGLRVLADAQGCYFIPFSSLGLGISRMNGRYGDDYIADQIHSTALGAYNTASGIWSYLKNIPCWHTSVPGAAQAFDGSQWNGKKWYAYGTSLTLGAGGGNYVTRVANFSGLIATNKGIGGGALVTNRNIYNALLDMTDGKLEADLITIEVGANDVGPLGEPWSTNTNEFYGALNHCIKSMFASGVQAQIVIMASYPVRYNPSDPTDIYDVDEEYNM